jgi:hypothetical protein
MTRTYFTGVPILSNYSSSVVIISECMQPLCLSHQNGSVLNVVSLRSQKLQLVRYAERGSLDLHLALFTTLRQFEIVQKFVKQLRLLFNQTLKAQSAFHL